MRNVVVAAVIMLALVPSAVRATDMQGTLSVVAYDRVTGSLGVAVIAAAPGCGSEVPWVQAGVGAIATQGEVNPSWGPRGLGLLREGLSPQAVCDTLYRSDPGYLARQVGAVDARGRAGGYTGIELVNFAGGVLDSTIAVQASALTRNDVLFAVKDTFLARSDIPFPERLLATLAVGAKAAGRPLRSAVLLVGRVDPERPADASRWIYLRVDDAPAPLAELERLLRVHSAARLVESHLHLADLATRTGRGPLAEAEKARARTRLDSALADTSLGAPALNALAWGLARHSAWLPEAESAARRALLIEGESVGVLDTLAEILGKKGDRDGALVAAKRALARSPLDEYLQSRVLAFGGTAADVGPGGPVHPNQKAREDYLKKKASGK